MKNFYETPEVGFVVFTATERIATTEHSGIPYNDEPAGMPDIKSQFPGEW